MALTLEQLLKNREDLNTRLGGLKSQLEMLTKQTQAAKLKLSQEVLDQVSQVDDVEAYVSEAFQSISDKLGDLESRVSELASLNLIGG